MVPTILRYAFKVAGLNEVWGNTSRISETDSHNPVLGSSRLNADDRLSLGSLGSVEGGNRIVESRHIADVHPQPPTPDSLGELT
jgi:hypothetical protein